MIWHVVRFNFGHVDASIRDEAEGALAALVDLDMVEFLRVGRDIQDPGVTGLVSGFADEAALQAYAQHPEHVTVVRHLREHGVSAVLLDMPSDDDLSVLA